MSAHPLNSFFLGLYRGVWKAATPLLRRHKRLGEGFDERLVPDDWPHAGGIGDNLPAYEDASAVRIWVQAASGGEAGLVHALVPALGACLAGQPEFAGCSLHLLCSTCTRQGMDVLRQIDSSASPFPLHIYPRYFPLDSPPLMAKALRQAEVQAIILLETELWPGLMAEARRAGTPVLVLNGRMTEKSASRYALLRPFFRSVAPEGVLAISDADAARFAGIFGRPERIAVMPNIKFDRLSAAPGLGAATDSRRENGMNEGDLLAVLASVREEEEEMLLSVVRDLFRRRCGGSEISLAVAPRHMHRLEAWQSGLSAAGISWRLRSRCREGGSGCLDARAGGPSVLLWDTFGDLPTLYAMGDAVFVGGSLVPLGGQNFLEPAALGLVPVTGRHIFNFLWVGEDFFTCGLGLRVENDALTAALLGQLEARAATLQGAATTEERQHIRRAEAEKGRERFLAWLAPRLGGSARATDAIVSVLLERRKSLAKPC